MLTALTSLALIALAIHTKSIYTRAMEDMLAESDAPAASDSSQARKRRSAASASRCSRK